MLGGTSTVTPPSHLETSPIVDPCGIAPQNFGVNITINNKIFIVMENLLTLATYLNTQVRVLFATGLMILMVKKTQSGTCRQLPVT